jgi:hypothetical protein
VKLYLEGSMEGESIEFEFQSNGTVKVSMKAYMNEKLVEAETYVVNKEWELFIQFLQR